jgi:hypothetical protein
MSTKKFIIEPYENFLAMIHTLDDQNVKGMFMGYSPTNKAYCVCLNNKRRIGESHDVTFNEAKMSR